MERRYPRCRSQAIRSFIPDSMRIFLAEPLSLKGRDGLRSLMIGAMNCIVPLRRRGFPHH